MGLQKLDTCRFKHLAGPYQWQANQCGGVIILNRGQQSDAKPFAFGASSAVVRSLSPLISLNLSIAEIAEGDFDLC